MKTLEAANLVFQSIFVLNSVKHEFFSVSIVKPLMLSAFLYPLEASENRMFSDVFRGYKKGTSSSNGLITNYLYKYK